MKIFSVIMISVLLSINLFGKTPSQEFKVSGEKQGILTQKDSFSENNGLFFKLKVQGIMLKSSSKKLNMNALNVADFGFQTPIYLEDTLAWGGGVSFGYQHFFIPQVGLRGYIDLMATNSFFHTEANKMLASQSGAYINTTLNVDLMTNLISFYGYNFGPFVGFGVGYMFLPTSINYISLSSDGSIAHYMAPQGFVYQFQIGAVLFKNKKGSQFEIGVQYIGVPNIAFDKTRMYISHSGIPNSPKVWAKNLNDAKTSFSNIAFYASWGYKF